MFRQIRWRIAFYYVVLVLVAMGCLSWYLTAFVKRTYLEELRTQLAKQALAVGDAVHLTLSRGDSVTALDVLAKREAVLLGSRVTIILPDGTVVGDSEEDWAAMDNHLTRPEVGQALAAGEGGSTRFSRTLGRNMMYVAVRTSGASELTPVVRIALPLSQVDANVAGLQRAIAMATLFTALVALIVAVAVAETTARPVRTLTELAQRLAEGDLDGRIVPGTRDETGTLARAFNRMADRLRASFAALDDERGRLSAVLEHMADGVIIVDEQGRVTLINPAAAQLLGVDQKGALGSSFAETVRDHRLIQAWQDCRNQRREQSDAADVDHQGLFLRIVATPLSDRQHEACMVILQDLTQVRRAETMRRDLLSNVSHELRTPLASLKALVNTLRGGALDDPPAAQHFLERMEIEVDAMTQMTEELLELARTESGRAPLQMALASVADLVAPPTERLRPQAVRAGLALTIDLPGNLPDVLADRERIQQVMSNLVHNAIKFTPPGGKVAVSAARGPGEVWVSVTDDGVGIDAADLSRVFERFYKADRARSGGGTGLGLSIAKHIVAAHHGRIWAESPVPNRPAGTGPGTRISFSLPIEGKPSSETGQSA